MKVYVRWENKKTGLFESDIEEIDNSLEDMQDMVEGYIETYPITEELIIICNEEGKLMNLPINLVVMLNDKVVDYICGDIFITKGDGNGEFTDLSDADIDVVKRMIVGNTVHI